MDFLHGICHEISDELLQLVIGLKSGTWEGGGKCEFFFSWKNFHLHVRKLRNVPTKNIRSTESQASFYAASYYCDTFDHTSKISRNPVFDVQQRIFFNVVTGDLSGVFFQSSAWTNLKRLLVVIMIM